MLAAAALADVPRAAAQADTAGAPLETGRTYRIASRVLGETRVVDVALPPGYAASPTRRYPVVVVLDGEFEHEIAAAAARFYATMSHIPPVIVVGVRNTDRMRDMTPPAAPGFTVPPEARTAGGADRFLEFVAGELLPWVEGRYRASPMRVLIGHSLSGLFVLHALAQRPALFTGYVVMEPSAWWNGRREWDAAVAALRTPAARRARVMFVNTARTPLDTTVWGGAAPMVRHLTTQGETHGSMALSGVMQGLRTMFADFRPGEWLPWQRPVAMLQRFDSLAERLGFPVPVTAAAYSRVVRMSAHSRFFADAESALARMGRELGTGGEYGALRALLERERRDLRPGFVPLEFPAHRPAARDAQRFLGRWREVGAERPYEIDVRISGDTLVLHARDPLPDGTLFEGDRPIVQLTADGALEWGEPVFRNIAALLILRGQVETDGRMTVRREVRGWVPQGPGPDVNRVMTLRRVP
jgi:predicted alpha/beta superfamily hydrolase